MQILILREGRSYGPYSAALARQFLDAGQLFPHDLARDAAAPAGSSETSLSRLLAQAGPSLPPPPPEGSFLTQTVQDLKSFDLRLVLPFQTAFTRGRLRDSRLIALALIGLLPAFMLSLIDNVQSGYWVIALYFSGLWSLFFYSLLKTAQVERVVCVICFFVTALVSISVLFVVQPLPPLSWFYALTKSPHLFAQLTGYFFGVGCCEELTKALVLFPLVRRPGRLLIPQTVVFYGMISGLGFGIYEGVQYQTGVNRTRGIDEAYLLNVVRLTSLPFLHAVWTGIAGYFIAFSALHPKRKHGLWVLAIVVPAAFHAIYDVSGWNVVGLGSAAVSVILLSAYLSSCAQLQQALSKR